jgi:hypothetical protein
MEPLLLPTRSHLRSAASSLQPGSQLAACGIFTLSTAADGPRTRSAYGSWLDSRHMSTNELSVQVAGAITIALIVGLGIFVYPWLLAQRYGPSIVGLMTILLGALFVRFQGSGSSAYSLAFAAGWALGPVIAGVIVHRIQRKSG